MFGSFEEAAERMVHVARTVEPDPARKSVYDEKYARYGEFVEALRRAWK
jgi:sugar (pentulose or hexulose) kinase